MTSRHQPPGPDGASVRRAVALGSAGADPGAMLAPATPPSSDGARAEAEEKGRSRPDASADGAAAASVRPATASGTAGEEAEQAEQAARTAPAAQSEAVAASAETQKVSAEAVPEAEAAVAMGEAAGDGSARGDDEPPSGNPKAPLLAAAGIAGVLFLAVPLLIWATDDSEKKDEVTVTAKSDTLLDDAPQDAPKGDYAPASPTAEPTSPKPSPKAKKQSAVPVAEPTVVRTTEVPAPEPTVTKTAAAKTEQETPKPPPNTAALAVQRLATSSPGRHVCYRAYVKGIGWQAPVCDGATAGTEGQDRPIKALNIAVTDTKGVNANEYVQGSGWPTKWEGVSAGTDLTIGSPRDSAPNLSGFAISVNDGIVCQNAQVSVSGWLGLKCDEPGGYIFGGDVNQKHWLEAVRFTV